MDKKERCVYLAVAAGVALLFYFANAQMMMIGWGAGLGAVGFALIGLVCGAAFAVVSIVCVARALHSPRGGFAAFVFNVLGFLLMNGILAEDSWVLMAVILLLAYTAAVWFFGCSDDMEAPEDSGALYRKIPKLLTVCLLPAIPVLFIILINL